MVYLSDWFYNKFNQIKIFLYITIHYYDFHWLLYTGCEFPGFIGLLYKGSGFFGLLYTGSEFIGLLYKGGEFTGFFGLLYTGCFLFSVVWCDSINLFNEFNLANKSVLILLFWKYFCLFA